MLNRHFRAFFYSFFPDFIYFFATLYLANILELYLPLASLSPLSLSLSLSFAPFDFCYSLVFFSSSSLFSHSFNLEWQWLDFPSRRFTYSYLEATSWEARTFFSSTDQYPSLSRASNTRLLYVSLFSHESVFVDVTSDRRWRTPTDANRARERSEWNAWDGDTRVAHRRVWA